MGTPSRLLLTLAVLAIAPAVHADPPAGEKYALLVGVRKYSETKELRPLLYTERDVTELRDVFREGGFRPENLVLMTQTAAAEDPRYTPNKARIVKELRLLLQDRTPADTVIVALAGHGVNFRDDKDCYFCPADVDLESRSNLLAIREVMDELEKCKAGVRLLLVDACRNDPFADHSRSANVASATRPALPEPPQGIVAFFSCSETEKAYEAEKLGHGVFFHYVIEGLRGAAAAEGGTVTMQGLSGYVTGKVSDFVRAEYQKTQKPELKGQLRGAMALISGGVNTVIARGYQLVQVQEFEKVMELMTKAVQTYPESAEVYQLRGLALLRRNQPGDLQRAIADLSAAVGMPRSARALVPMLSKASAHHLRGAAFMRVRDYPRAAADCTEAIRLDPSDSSVYVTRSFVNLASKQYDAAIADCNEGLRRDPALIILYQARGTAYSQKGDRARGQADLLKYRQLSSSPAPGAAPAPGG
jgi:hypothetical protein